MAPRSRDAPITAMERGAKKDRSAPTAAWRSRSSNRSLASSVISVGNFTGQGVPATLNPVACVWPTKPSGVRASSRVMAPASGASPTPPSLRPRTRVSVRLRPSSSAR